TFKAFPLFCEEDGHFIDLSFSVKHLFETKSLIAVLTLVANPLWDGLSVSVRSHYRELDHISKPFFQKKSFFCFYG
ncbi:hypothetical protein, partial [Aliivibrio fischeri]|uniref:hypothetical protein n=1 Tax=Aliivibrio fischeri TaxID=668 RepID=UPI00196A0F5D